MGRGFDSLLPPFGIVSDSKVRQKYINAKEDKTQWQEKTGVVSGSKSTISLVRAPFVILDMDGTLYRFDSKSFTSSRFYQNLKERIYAFFMSRMNISREEAEKEYERIKLKYGGEVSLGVEKEYGINRYSYFDNTWSMNPVDYIEKKSLRKMLLPLTGRTAILTSAPRVWAKKVLKYLEVYDIFENSLFTGEPDTRKPDVEAFQNVLDSFRISPNNAFSIGDQESTDIIPAKKLGMKTIILGKSNLADIQAKSLKEALRFVR